MVDDARHVLVTGGAGFIGSHLVDALLSQPGTRVTVLDRLSHGGDRANLRQHDEDPRFTFVLGDVNDPAAVEPLASDADVVVHAAAESHVDRSIAGPREFIVTNILGTYVVLEACRRTGRRMLMVSTDEVYGTGSAEGGLFSEDDPLVPRSPYAAAKAAADLLCHAYFVTYGVPVTVARGTNAFGPRQTEKVIPVYTTAALEGRPLPVYGDGMNRREFVYVTDWARAALTVLDRGEPGMVYNIGDGFELANLELARRICALVGVPESLISFVADRPGHDFRYGVRSDRLRSLGWSPEVPFDEGLSRTVQWFRDQRERATGSPSAGATR
jgi:dTDP-glucose 4,6-dehydratase